MENIQYLTGKFLAPLGACRGFRFVNCGLGILLALLAVTSDMKAQCPTNIDPVSVTWTAVATPITTTFSCPLGTCTIAAHYCTRLVPNPPLTPIVEIYIDEMTITGSCACVSFNAALALAKQTIWNFIGSGFPACSSTDILTGTAYTSSCMDPIPTFGGIDYVPCDLGSSYCAQTCTLCYSGGVVTSTDCSFSTVGTPDCQGSPCFQVTCE